MVCDSYLLTFLGVIIALLAARYAFVKHIYTYWKKSNVPYFEPSFPFGNLSNPYRSSEPISFGSRIAELYREAKSRGYRHLGIYFMLSSAYLVVDLELVKNVMTKDFIHFVDRGIYTNEKDDPLSAHLFAVGGKKWRNLRTKVTPTFTSSKMKNMFQTLADCGLLLENYLEEYAEAKEAVNMKKVLGYLSTDIIGSCAFGLECNSFKEPDSPFRRYAKMIFTPDHRIIGFIKILILHNYQLARFLGLRQTDKIVSDFFTKVVKDTINYREKNNYVRNDFLQLLINLRDKNEGNGKKDKHLLTMNEIMAQCYVFFIAAFETSSSAMSFALFELARHPTIQDKVREEIQKVLVKHDNKITYDSMTELKYMGQVIDETLRKYAPLSFITRECVLDYKVPGEDVVIEKGTRVIIPVRGIHYDEEYYPDPEKFDPERFSEENKKTRSRYTHMPFGEGPRICIGQRFGTLETKVGLTSILRKFKVTLNEKTQAPLKINPRAFITACEGGIWLNLEKL